MKKEKQEQQTLMEDDTENHNQGNGLSRDSPESPCAKSQGSSDHQGNQPHHNKEQDRFLPIANVGRIMKKVIPGNGKISKDAKETVQECVSEFISFVTGEACDRCQREKRKTINGDDILCAISTLGFENYWAPLQTYLKKYRDIEGEKLNVPKQQRGAEQRSSSQIQQQEQHQENKPSFCYNTVYSPTSLIPPPAFSIPFSPTSIHKQLQPKDHLDSVAHW